MSVAPAFAHPDLAVIRTDQIRLYDIHLLTFGQRFQPFDIRIFDEILALDLHGFRFTQK